VSNLGQWIEAQSLASCLLSRNETGPRSSGGGRAVVGGRLCQVDTVPPVGLERRAVTLMHGPNGAKYWKLSRGNRAARLLLFVRERGV
jgi:hypothetical protein